MAPAHEQMLYPQPGVQCYSPNGNDLYPRDAPGDRRRRRGAPDPGEPVDGAAPGRRQRVSTQEKKSHAIEETMQRARGEIGTDGLPLRSAPSLPAPPVSSTRPTHLPRARTY